MQISISDTRPSPGHAHNLRQAFIARAQTEGFGAIGFADAEQAEDMTGVLTTFTGLGRHGDMHWLAETASRRAHPKSLWPEVRTVIMLGLNYGPDTDPMAALAHKTQATISVYARGRDYHDVVKGKLKTLAGWLHSQTASEVKVFVDTAPVMEKPLAARAGLGWQGKHTNLVSHEFGSWMFLGSIFTAASFPADTPASDHCGTCRRCLDICPTNAFPAPYQIDARRCISYLTIEHKGHIPREFRTAMGNRVYGCDDCLAVCPWNKFAQVSAEGKFQATEASDNPPLAELLTLDDAAFRARFAGSPIKRTGRDRFMRNVLIAAGNSGEPGLVGKVIALLADPSPLVRCAAIWALGELLKTEPAALIHLKDAMAEQERDPDVRSEWEQIHA